MVVVLKVKMVKVLKVVDMFGKKIFQLTLTLTFNGDVDKGEGEREGEGVVLMGKKIQM